MLTVAGYCTSRLAVARRSRRPTDVDSDGMHVVTGVAMAGMLMTGPRFGPSRFWEAIFAAAAAWFGWQFIQARRGATTGRWRCPQPMPHLVECAAMLYMFFALPAIKSTSGMNGMAISSTGSRFSLLALVLVLFLLTYVVQVADRLVIRNGTVSVSAPHTGCSVGQPYLAPRCAALCKIAMATTMSYMLILML
jgi:hypothetical protein